MSNNTQTILTDNQRLVGAKNQFNRDIPVYDDGWGKLYIHRDSTGINGIVRAQTWEDAYGIVEDEFLPAADPKDITEEALIKEFGENWSDDTCFQEQYGFRNNARREKDGTLSSIYAKDLNGDALDEVSERLLKDLEITLIVEDDDRPEKLSGLQHDLRRARQETYRARWAAVKIEKFTAEEALDLDEKLKWIETDIKELRATLGLEKLK